MAYIPKVGERVLYSKEPEATFIVHRVHEHSQAADVRQMNTPGYGANASTMVGVPWEALTPLETSKREDMNQAAARIVKEATERT
jgi:hypothetical protein